MKTTLRILLVAAIVVCFAAKTLMAQMEEWQVVYSGTTTNGTDQAFAIVCGDSGYSYVTGYVSNTGTVVDMYTVKYDANGAVLWSNTYDAVNGNDWGNAIAIDKKGNVYVTGRSDSTGTDADIITIMYKPNGDSVWGARYYDTLAAFSDYGSSIAVDDYGNVYVCGRVNDGSSPNYIVLKYDNTGKLKWSKTYDPNGGDDYAWAIAVDASGNVYVTGESDGTTTLRDYATIKYDSLGTQLWVKRYFTTTNGFDVARALVLNDSGHVFVTGYSQGNTGTTGMDYATIKYDSNGDTVWVRRYNGTLGNGVDWGKDLKVDKSGNVYVTGKSQGSGTNYDYLTIKYNASGDSLWTQRYNNPAANNIDLANAIGLDNYGNCYVSGGSYGFGTSSDYMTIKYNSAGTQMWSERKIGLGSYDEVLAMCVHPNGNIFVTGKSIQSGVDFLTVKYCQNPVASAGNDTSMCTGDTAFLAASGGVTYSWTPSAFLSSTTIRNPFTTTTVTRDYIVTVFNGTGCWLMDTVTITVNAGAVADAGNDTTICQGDTVQLIGTGGTIYAWTPSSSLLNANTATPLAFPTDTTTYGLLVINLSGCVDFDTVIVNVNPAPIAGFTSSDTVLVAMFTDTSQYGTSWIWYFGDGDTSHLQNPTHVYMSPGSYQVCLVTINSCGKDSTCDSIGILITSLANILGDHTINIYPNPFTNSTVINFDPRNGFSGENIEFVLYDLVGTEIRRIQINQRKVVLDREDLSNGVYIYKVVNQQGSIGNGKLVIY
ncbi:MAG: SBBP repeat-containing protein [Bacteroidetes bacterium]|nr:SBBP repeat-containing protein [Bacteroidota bacterium]